MAIIALEGMHFYAYHGFYKEEQLIGTDYIVDVYLTTEVNQAAVADDLNKAINYETVYLICEATMRKNSKLIETVAERIALNLKHQFGNIQELKIRLRKKNPPLGGRVDWAMIEVDGNFKKNCGRCGRPMLCYSDKTCWCLSANLKTAALESLKEQYGRKCLCKECLDFFAG
ncbi:MAG: dihydroneopterin aldolase [Saprospiraceae bacterium]|nr:dihydroneopterin aldolase [Saprospiraceae bacterium]MCB0623664.1 dihydroneopterin aldolase [Saprospiraceae bacterium]MCB0679006.1 dihydroneopterin aldolase [Saprospiraceae bacterium]MCB0682873.1 dihydroneopterin aldolase [Saprospiraceae bacterium]